jgi:hypothetical protein
MDPISIVTGLLGTIVQVVIALAPIFLANRLGKSNAELAQSDENLNAVRRQLQVANNAPRTIDEAVAKL